MLTTQDKAVQTLTGLGLTVLQAKVYLVLAREGKSTVKDLAKTSNVARQDIYRITTELLNIGLIGKLVDTPTKFKAIPVKAAVEMLIERKKKETAQLEQASAEVIRSFMETNEEVGPRDEESQFTIMNDLQARLIKGKKQILSTEKSIRISTNWAFFVTYTLENVEEFAEALKRGVNIRIVTQKPENVEKLPKKLQSVMQHPLFKIKYASSMPSSIVAVFDEKEVNIPLLPHTAPSRSGVLLSNNPSLVELAENYFETMWNNAAEDVNEHWE